MVETANQTAEKNDVAKQAAADVHLHPSTNDEVVAVVRLRRRYVGTLVERVTGGDGIILVSLHSPAARLIEQQERGHITHVDRKAP